MKEFTLNENTFYAKFYKAIYWELPNNFCTYFWRIALNLGICFAAFNAFVAGLILLLELEFLRIAIAVGLVVFLSALFSFIFSLLRKSTRKKKINKEPNLIKVAYHSFKNKYCPMIKWEN